MSNRTTSIKTFDIRKYAYNNSVKKSIKSEYIEKKRRLPQTINNTSDINKTDNGENNEQQILKEVPDYIKLNCDLLITGINPGITSSNKQHHFAHPSNQFYTCLFESGITDRKLKPEEDYTLPIDYNHSITNLNSRPTKTANQLSKAESRKNVPNFIEKVTQIKPLIVCMIGKGIWVDIEYVIKNYVKSDSKNFKNNNDEDNGFLLRNYKIVYKNEDDDDGSYRETLFFTLPSTSGLVTHYQKPEKVEAFRKCKDTLEQVKNQMLDTSDMKVIDIDRLI